MAGLDGGAGEFVSTFHQYNYFGLAIAKKGIHTVISICEVFETMNGSIFVIHCDIDMRTAIGIIPDGLTRDQRRRLIHPMDNDLGNTHENMSTNRFIRMQELDVSCQEESRLDMTWIFCIWKSFMSQTIASNMCFNQMIASHFCHSEHEMWNSPHSLNNGLVRKDDGLASLLASRDSLKKEPNRNRLKGNGGT
jgi:hypothetical protein